VLSEGSAVVTVGVEPVQLVASGWLQVDLPVGKGFSVGDYRTEVRKMLRWIER
jgi:hypothetical protein